MKISLTSRDFNAYFDELKEVARTTFGSWTKFSESNIGVLFLELMATMGDQNSFYLNRVINEAFLATVTQRRNALKILRRMSYKLGGIRAASVDLTFSFKNNVVHTSDVVLPAGFVCKTDDGENSFETTAELMIPAGALSGTITAMNQISRTDSLSFDGTPCQEKTLVETGYIEDSVELYIEEVLWERKDDLLDSTGNSRDYKVEVDDDLRAVIVFGDGVNGMKPTGMGIARYKTGGGEAANSIEVDSITKLNDTISDVNGDRVEILVTNLSSPSGGEDEESLEEARKMAPKAKKSISITVSRDQYERHAEEVDGVARVLAFGKKEESSVPDNYVYLYIVPVGGGVSTLAIKDSVRDQLENPKKKPIVMTTFINILDAMYKNVSIAGTVTKKVGFDAAAVKIAVDTALREYFDYENIDDNNEYTINFGFYSPTLYLSTLISIIMNAEVNGMKCVENVTLSEPSSNITLSKIEIPSLASLNGLVVA